MTEAHDAALWLAAALGICCVSVPALVGGAAVVGGAAGATAVSTGIRSLRSLAVIVLVTGVTLAPVYLAWRWRSG